MEPQPHYFSPNPETPSQPAQIRARLRGLPFTFTTDAETFSRARVDTGSRLLIEKAELTGAHDILDLGCGWGLFGTVAARCWPEAAVVMVDLNARACELATANLAANGVTNARVLCGDAPLVLGEMQFDAVLCNPPIRVGKAAVLRLLTDAAIRLRPAGTLWLVARTDKGAKTLARDISPQFASVRTVTMRSGYRLFECLK